MTAPRLDQTPSHEALKTLREAKLLSSASFWEGIQAINSQDAWARWASRLCLLLGCALLLAATVYFFAFNWDALSRWQKLGLLEAATLAALAGGQVIGFTRLGGQLCLLSASVFIGVSFAVFGQVYQTGADAFGFFAMWALCITPWVLTASFAPLWVLWITLINLTAYFFWDQVGQFHDKIHFTYLCVFMTVINGCGLILRESYLTGYAWLRGAWIRPVLATGTLVPILIPALNLMIDRPSKGGGALLLGTVFWLLSLGGAHFYYTRVRFDSTVLCLILGSAATYLIAGAARAMDALDFYEGGAGFLLMTLLIGGVTTLIVQALRWLKSRHSSGKERTG